jgi:two-component system, cell cycle sensor histidine kinase and response regulator CckA
VGDDESDAVRRLKAQVLDALRAEIAVLDGDGRILVVNAAWERFARQEGGDPARCGAGVNYLEVCDAVTGEDAHQARAAAVAIHQALRGEACDEAIEYPCHSPDVQRWFRMRVRPLNGDDGGRAVVLHENITARREDRQARRRARRRIRTVLKSLAEGVVLVDCRGRIRYANARASEIAGVPRADLLRRDPVVFFPPSIAAELRQAGSDCLKSDIQDRYETDYVRPDGERLHLQVHTTPARNAGGRVVGVVATFTDITAHRQALDALERAEAHYRRLVDTSPYGIYQLDLAGRFTALNPAVIALLARSRTELLGMPYALVLAPDSVPLASGVFRRVTTGESDNEELAVDILRPSGERRALRITATAVREDGAIVGLHGVARDETEHRELLAQLLQSQKLEAVGQLAGGVAHDFNNILTAIGGNAEMLGTTLSAGDPAWEDLGEILDTVERARRLTRQLLLFSPKREVQPEHFDLAAAIAGMLPLLRRLIGEDVRLTSQLATGSGTVHMDPNHLEQVLLNLALNARDAMPQGGELRIETMAVHLEASLRARTADLAPGDYALLAVSDTGAGIEPGVMEHMFDPFFTTKGAAGTGLGLSTVLGIVQGAGGGIQAESVPGEGTRFQVLLPCASEVAARAPHDGGSEPAPTGLTILLAEDDAGVREVTRRFLDERGNHVLLAASGEEALALAASHAGPIDLLLSDVIMPGMSGRELWERLRALRPDTPVLFVTGFPGEHLERHGLRLEEEFVLYKPFTRRELYRAIRHARER